MNMRIAIRILLIVTVFLLLALWSWRRHSHRSVGIYVGLPAQSSTLVFNDMVLTISKQHSVKINNFPVPFESLVARLKIVDSQRYRHILLVRADPDTSFQEVLGVVDIARGAVPDVQLVVLTPKVEKTTICYPVEEPNKMD
jgi:biopolymer transport protein ExbD